LINNVSFIKKTKKKTKKEMKKQRKKKKEKIIPIVIHHDSGHTIQKDYLGGLML
jgi:bifunctional DNase/RNase